MCGITGQFSKTSEKIDESIFLQANNAASHRGPDGFGVLGYASRTDQISFFNHNDNYEIRQSTQPNLLLGHRRLAIIDISHGADQPLVSIDQRYAIVFNGEIYNYRMLRAELESRGAKFRTESDTEVIVEAYKQWGPDCVNKFRGMWAFALLDRSKQLLFCSRDRFGIKPFFYFNDAKNFVFASEIKQLKKFPFVTRSPNDKIIFDYLNFGVTDHCPETFFENIFRLMPGHNLTVDLNSCTVLTSKYYAPKFEINRSTSFAESSAKLRTLFLDSLDQHLVSDVPVGSLLSGGLDSSAIVCAATKNQLANPVTCVFTSQFKEKSANEEKFVDVVLKECGLDCYRNSPTGTDFDDDLDALVETQDEPFGSTSIYAQYSIFKLIRKTGIKVVLDGQGADELLAGYFGFFATYLNELKKNGSWIKAIWESALHIRTNPAFVSTRFFRQKTDEANQIKNTLISESFRREFESASAYTQFLKSSAGPQKYQDLNDLLYACFFHTNLPALLRYEDRNSMAHSIESRVPFVDQQIVEYCFSLPSKYKIRNGYTKSVFRNAMEGILPRKIQWRLSKLGFATPEVEWMKNHLSDKLNDALQNPAMRRYVNIDSLAQFYSHSAKNDIKDFTLWRYINLNLWLNQNF